MRAIETTYQGVRFRSRLEARWAVFFDAMGIKWEYERQGFELPSGRYLPDFWLPSVDAWYEVKGQRPTEREYDLIGELAMFTDQRCFLAWGDIPRPGVDPYDDTDSIEMYEAVRNVSGEDDWLGADINYAWCVCPTCGKPGITYAGRGARVCGHIPCACGWDYCDKCYTWDDKRIQMAYTRARSARFEHGEAPSSTPIPTRVAKPTPTQRCPICSTHIPDDPDKMRFHLDWAHGALLIGHNPDPTRPF